MAFENHEAVQKESVLHNFANETTLHGLPKIIKPSNILRRTIWFGLFSCSLAVLVWQASELVNQYLSFKTTVSVKVDQSAIQFPSVTICDENGVNMEMREDVAQHVNGYNFISIFNPWNYSVFHDLTIDDKVNRTACSPPQVCDFKQAYLKWFASIAKTYHADYKENHQFDGYVLAANLGLDVATIAGLRLKNVVYVCTISGRPCQKKDFVTYRHNKYLLCHTFKDKRKAQVGRNQGLKLVLKYQPVSTFLEELNTMLGLSRADVSPGFRISVHHPESPPSLDNNGFIFYPGVRSSLAFTKSTYIRLAKPYGNCSTNVTLRKTNTPYSVTGCVGEYRQDVIRSQCNCTDISLPHKEDDVDMYPFCRKLTLQDECGLNGSFWSKVNNLSPDSFENVPAECISEIRKFSARYKCMVNASNTAYTRITRGNLDLQCYPPCYQAKYEVHDTDSVWPSSDGFFQTLGQLMLQNTNNKQDEIGEMFYLAQRGGSTQFLINDFRSKFLQLNVYLKDADVMTNTEEILYNWYQLLSELGGLVGLYIGMSLMTLCEIIELLLIKLWGLLCTRGTKVEAFGK